MRVHSSTRYAAMALLVGALACAGNTAREADTDETAAARDTTFSDTLGGDAQNRTGDRAMEDSVSVPQYPETSDTFLQNQGPGQSQGQDTSGYSGMERVDTTGQQGQTDTSGQMDTTGAAGDTTGAWGADTSAMNQGATDSAGMTPTGDTTGYDNSQENPSDTTTSR